MATCQAITKKKKVCGYGQATFDPASGQWLCHLHHPEGVYRKQVSAQREERKARAPREPRKPRRPRMWSLNVRRSDHFAPAETPPLKDRC